MGVVIPLYSERRHEIGIVEGQGQIVAKVIEFYTPDRFRKSEKWIPAEQRGKILEFRPAEPKAALKSEKNWPFGWTMTTLGLSPA